jgi:hypothetical protein
MLYGMKEPYGKGEPSLPDPIFGGSLDISTLRLQIHYTQDGLSAKSFIINNMYSMAGW